MLLPHVKLKKKKTAACADSINSDLSAHMNLNILHLLSLHLYPDQCDSED